MNPLNSVSIYDDFLNMCESSILHPLRLQNLARDWLLEDCPSFDFASAALGGMDERKATIYMKSEGVLAGAPFVNAVFGQLGLKAEWLHQEGDIFEPSSPVPVAKVTGDPARLLLAERVALNVLSRASGVASAAKTLRGCLPLVKWHGALAGTRKTTPGFRMVEKYALAVGHVDMHRYDLSSMVMLKDNHICLVGSVKKAVEETRRVAGFSMKIEVECATLEQALEACEAKCDIIMFDNLSPDECSYAAQELKARFPKVLVEASGGITSENIALYASPYIDIISCSSLVQGYRTVDFSMKIDCTPPPHRM